MHGALTYPKCISHCHAIARQLPTSLSLYEPHRIERWLDYERLGHNAGPPRLSEYVLFKQLKEANTVRPPTDWITQSPRADDYYTLLHLVNILSVADLILSDRFMARQIPRWLETLKAEIPQWQ